MLQLRKLLLCLHDELLQARLIFFQFNQLFLQLVVFIFLSANLSIKLIKVCHDEWVDHLDVFIVLRGEMVLHQRDFLSKQVDLLLVVPHVRHRVSNDALNECDLTFAAFLLTHRNFSCSLSQ